MQPVQQAPPQGQQPPQQPAPITNEQLIQNYFLPMFMDINNKLNYLCCNIVQNTTTTTPTTTNNTNTTDAETTDAESQPVQQRCTQCAALQQECERLKQMCDQVAEEKKACEETVRQQQQHIQELQQLTQELQQQLATTQEALQERVAEAEKMENDIEALKETNKLLIDQRLQGNLAEGEPQQTVRDSSDDENSEVNDQPPEQLPPTEQPPQQPETIPTEAPPQQPREDSPNLTQATGPQRYPQQPNTGVFHGPFVAPGQREMNPVFTNNTSNSLCPYCRSYIPTSTLAYHVQTQHADAMAQPTYGLPANQPAQAPPTNVYPAQPQPAAPTGQPAQTPYYFKFTPTTMPPAQNPTPALVPAPAPVPAGLVECEVCHKKMTPEEFRNHENTPFMCPFCHLVFTNANNMTNHVDKEHNY